MCGVAVYPAAFDYLDPTSVPEAIDFLQSHEGEDVKVLAGGQSLIPLMRLRFARPSYLVDLNRIRALRSLNLEGGWLQIGALVRESELERSREVRQRFEILYETTRVIADPSVRNLATVGGNLAHGDPANDHPATMMALDASVVADGPQGERVIPVRQFFLGLFETALEPAEILTEIRIPPVPPDTGLAYRKLKRQVGDFAIVGVAARLSLTSGIVSDAHLVYTNVGATPQRIESAAQGLVGHQATEEAFWSAGTAAANALELRDDIRGSSLYRHRVVRALTTRALCAARERASDGGDR